MNSIFTTTALASALLLGTIATATVAKAEDSQPKTPECMGENCPGGAMQGGGEQTGQKKRMRSQQNGQTQQNDQVEDQSDGQDMPRKKRMGSQQDNNDGNADARKSTRVGDGGWRFDSNRHQRRNNKTATFRFYYGGFWYPQPYWEVYRPRNRLSCGEGRGIVSERFSRVRVVECNGGTYTYMGRSRGDTYRVLLNSRTGRIVGRTPI